MNIVVLISGRGSNLQSLIDKIQSRELDVTIDAVISNEAGVFGLQRAANADITTHVIDHRDFSGRKQFDQALQSCVDQYKPQLIVLAGFMRVLTSAFVEHYTGRLINIHPALLPKFPGLHTHARAIEAKDKEHGVSVHFVTQEVDGGPVIAQAAVPIMANDTEETLATRVLQQEHQIYPQVLQWFAENRIRLEADTVYFDNQAQPVTGISTTTNKSRKARQPQK